ncbi:MAG: energy transducer TonB [Flavobacteriaceae bacterium]|nr:energy transducer TonB [Flavobacteriaceae bacterium]
MKTIKKLLHYFEKNNVEKPKSKKDANLKYNSVLYFQFSLIISITLVAIVINATYGVKSQIIAKPLPEDTIEVWLNDFVIIEPKAEPIVEKNPIKKVNPDRVRITDDPISKDIEIETEPEPILIQTDKPVSVISVPKPAPVEDKTYTFAGVERVPVFPGCESLNDNNQRKNCLSSEIGKLVSKRFNTGIAESLGLNGNQRIYVSFVINKDGQVANIQVSAPHPKLEKEAKRVVNMIPKMIPASQNNKKVDVLFNLPIIFNVH